MKFSRIHSNILFIKLLEYEKQKRCVFSILHIIKQKVDFNFGFSGYK